MKGLSFLCAIYTTGNDLEHSSGVSTYVVQSSGSRKAKYSFIFVSRFDGEALLLVISLHYKLLEIYLGFLIWGSLNFSFLHSFVRQTARVVDQSRGDVVAFFKFFLTEWNAAAIHLA